MAWHAPGSCLLSGTGVPAISLPYSLLISYCLLMCQHFSEDFVCKLYKPDLSWYKKKNRGSRWKWAGVDPSSGSIASARRIRIQVAWECCHLGVPISSDFLCYFHSWSFSNWNWKKKKNQACVTWRPSCRTGVSPFFSPLSRDLRRSRLSPLIVLSQTLSHFFFQSKGTHTHGVSGNGDERLGPRKRKWTFLWQKPDLGSHFSLLLNQDF